MTIIQKTVTTRGLYRQEIAKNPSITIKTNNNGLEGI
jgi:hypothetical protein